MGTTEKNSGLRSERVHAALLEEILSGRMQPGDPVASERSLAESYEVNRHAVREALKRLQQAGLIEITHGGATKVLDWRRTGGLDLLSDLVASKSELDRELLLSVLQARRSIGIDAARAFADRTDDDHRRQLATFKDDPPAGGDDVDQRRFRYIQLWDVVIDGSGSLVYRLAFNSLIAGSAQMMLAHGHLFEDEEADRDAQVALVDACLAGDSRAAIRCAIDLLDRAVVKAGASSVKL